MLPMKIKLILIRKYSVWKIPSPYLEGATHFFTLRLRLVNTYLLGCDEGNRKGTEMKNHVDLLILQAEDDEYQHRMYKSMFKFKGGFEQNTVDQKTTHMVSFSWVQFFQLFLFAVLFICIFTVLEKLNYYPILFILLLDHTKFI